MRESTNSDAFLAAFRRLERTLRDTSGEGADASLARCIDAAGRNSSLVRRYSTDIRELCDLRNAIVHERTNDNRVIAEPHDSTVDLIARIVSVLEEPPKALAYATAPVSMCDAGGNLSELLKIMRERDLSQVPVGRDDSLCGLVTAEAITRWLESQFLQHDELAENAAVEEILPYRPPDEDMKCVRRDATVTDLLQCFEEAQSRGVRMAAVLITENGRTEELPLGILTVSDIPKLYRALDS